MPGTCQKDESGLEILYQRSKFDLKMYIPVEETEYMSQNSSRVLE